jgi:hypothetical protein
VRTSLILSLILAAAATASAEPSRTVCFAGSQHIKIGGTDMSTRNVVERTFDPAKSEIRQRSWTDKDPSRENATTSKVDVAAGTMEVEDPTSGAKGTGKLDGKAWHWTGLKMTINAGGATIETTSTMTEKSIHQEGTISQAGAQVGTLTGDLAAFNCKQLEAKKKELAKPADTKAAPKK